MHFPHKDGLEEFTLSPLWREDSATSSPYLLKNTGYLLCALHFLLPRHTARIFFRQLWPLAEVRRRGAADHPVNTILTQHRAPCLHHLNRPRSRGRTHFRKKGPVKGRGMEMQGRAAVAFCMQSQRREGSLQGA